MKPTDEERREVAARLRTMCVCGCRYAEQFCELLNETVMDAWDFHDFPDVAYRLADLIEPAPERTCVPIVAKVEAVDWEDCYVVECNRCRHSFGGFFDDLEKAERFARSLPVYYQRYCAGCGARVEGAVE